MDHRCFSGPEFLYKKEDDWPQRKRIKEEERSEDCVAEITKPKMTFATEENPLGVEGCSEATLTPAEMGGAGMAQW